MNSQMMALGLFVFTIDTLAYQEFKRRSSARHAQGPRVGVRPANQFVGPGEDQVTLSGWFAPALRGDPASLDQLRDMMDEGEAWPVVTGYGEVLGAWVIDDVEEGRSEFFPDGAPRRIEFTLALHRIPEEDARDARAGSETVVTTPLVGADSPEALAAADAAAGLVSQAEIDAINQAAGGGPA